MNIVQQYALRHILAMFYIRSLLSDLIMNKLVIADSKLVSYLLQYRCALRTLNVLMT